MIWLRHTVEDVQVVTELDREQHFEHQVKLWLTLGYKPLGQPHVATATIRPEKSQPHDTIIYMVVMVKRKWRLSK